MEVNIDIEQHNCLEEAGTQELIDLIQEDLDTKLDSNDAEVNSTTGTITIKGQSITVPEEYELPTASADELGGIKVGEGLSIDSETGVLSADTQSITVDDELDDTSENPVQNKVLTPVLESLSTMITKISKQKVDLWWGMDDAPYIDIGNAIIYLDGIVEDIIPEIGIAEDVNE